MQNRDAAIRHELTGKLDKDADITLALRGLHEVLRNHRSCGTTDYAFGEEDYDKGRQYRCE